MAGAPQIIRKDEALAAFGGGRGAVQKLAASLKITSQAVSHWRKWVPREAALRLMYEILPDHPWVDHRRDTIRRRSLDNDP